MAWLNSIMILIGMALLAASLKPISDILTMVREGRLHRMWRILVTLIILFIIGYAVYGTLSVVSHINRIVDLIVSTILLAGGAFVLIVAHLSAFTTRDIVRIAKLESDVIRDPLTGAFNRRYLDQMIEAEVAIAKRSARPLSALLIDLDHFKHVNDTYGHPVGDLVLRHVARLILDCCRTSDRVVRYGGEEFLVVALDSDLNDVATLGRRLLHEIAGTSITLPNGTYLKITASIGAASLSRDDDQDNFIDRADEALYAAKRGGRNRLCSCPPAASQAAAKREYVTVLAETQLAGAA